MRKETLEREFAYHETNGKKPYFEGWYYKIQTSEVSVGVIVGIHYEKGIRNGFIQVLDTYRNISDYLVFPDEDIHIEEHKIKFKENEFTRHYLHFHDEEKQLHMMFNSTNSIICMTISTCQPSWDHFLIWIWNARMRSSVYIIAVTESL